MTYTNDERDALYSFMRERTVDLRESRLPASILTRRFRVWAAENGYCDAAPATVRALVARAGYAVHVVITDRPDKRPVRRYVVHGLELKPQD